MGSVRTVRPPPAGRGAGRSVVSAERALRIAHSDPHRLKSLHAAASGYGRGVHLPAGSNPRHQSSRSDPGWPGLRARRRADGADHPAQHYVRSRLDTSRALPGHSRDSTTQRLVGCACRPGVDPPGLDRAAADPLLHCRAPAGPRRVGDHALDLHPRVAHRGAAAGHDGRAGRRRGSRPCRSPAVADVGAVADVHSFARRQLRPADPVFDAPPAAHRVLDPATCSAIRSSPMQASATSASITPTSA